MENMHPSSSCHGESRDTVHAAKFTSSWLPVCLEDEKWKKEKEASWKYGHCWDWEEQEEVEETVEGSVSCMPLMRSWVECSDSYYVLRRFTQSTSTQAHMNNSGEGYILLLSCSYGLGTSWFSVWISSEHSTSLCILLSFSSAASWDTPLYSLLNLFLLFSVPPMSTLSAGLFIFLPLFIFKTDW